MNGKQLKNSILQWAIQGKLVPPVCRQAGKTLMTNPVPREKGKECWFTYVIECEDGSFYKGFTDNLLRRYQQHCNGTGADYTKTHKPKQLYYWEMHYSKEAALQREKYLKSGVGREWFKKEVVDKPENFEPASVLLEKIRQEKERLIKEKKIKRDKNASIIYRGEDNSYYEKILATGEVKCIDEEVPFEIPQGWEWCRMGCIGDWGAGATPAKGNPDYYGGSILWLRTGELNNGIVNDSEIKITDKALQECSLRMNKIGDVLIAMYGATIGKVAIVGKELTTNQACCACTPFGIYNYYLFFFLMGSQIDFIKKGEGGAQPNISREKLISHLIPIPPLAEQHRIVEKIQYLLPLVEKYSNSQILQNKLNSEIKDKLRKSILQEAIQGKLVPQIAEEGTAHELLEQIKAEKQKLVKEGKLKKSALNDSVIFRGDNNKYYEQIGKKCLDITDEIPFVIPETWQWIKLEQGISLLSGRDLEPSQYNDLHHGIPYITGASNFANSNLIINRWTEAPITISNKGDLLLTCKGTIGSMAFNDIGQIHIARQVMAITSYGIDLKYIKCFLQSNLSILEKNANSMIPGISRSTLLSMMFPLPPLKEQQRIVAQIEKLFEQLR